ncbi:unnamed protein product [Aphanomyces euteiches]
MKIYSATAITLALLDSAAASNSFRESRSLLAADCGKDCSTESGLSWTLCTMSQAGSCTWQGISSAGAYVYNGAAGLATTTPHLLHKATTLTPRTFNALHSLPQATTPTPRTTDTPHSLLQETQRMEPTLVILRAALLQVKVHLKVKAHQGDNKETKHKAHRRVNKDKASKDKASKDKANKDKANKDKANNEANNRVNKGKASNRDKVNKARVNKDKVNRDKVNKARVNKDKVNRDKVNKARVNKDKVNKANNKARVSKASNKAKVNKEASLEASQMVHIKQLVVSFVLVSKLVNAI